MKFDSLSNTAAPKSPAPKVAPPKPVAVKPAPAKTASSEMFSPKGFAMPKPPAVLPLVPPPLKGYIFRGRMALPPLVSVQPVAGFPLTPVNASKRGATPAGPSHSEPRVAAAKGGAAYLRTLMAKGLPKPPPALSASVSGANSPAAPAPSTGPAKLITVNDLATDRAACVQTVSAYVQKAGGAAKPLNQLADGKTTVTGVVVAIPDASLDDFLKFMSGTGQIRDRESWSGTADRRRAKLAEDGASQLASLKKLRDALLGTYLADSDPVKDTDAEIARASDYLKQLQPPDGSDGMTLVRVNFVVY